MLGTEWPASRPDARNQADAQTISSPKNARRTLLRAAETERIIGFLSAHALGADAAVGDALGVENLQGLVGLLGRGFAHGV